MTTDRGKTSHESSCGQLQGLGSMAYLHAVFFYMGSGHK